LPFKVHSETCILIGNGYILMNTHALDEQSLSEKIEEMLVERNLRGTRRLIIDILAKEGSLPLEERTITIDEVNAADEIWITSSSKEIAPVTQLDNKVVGNGKVGPIWLEAATLYSMNKFSY